MGVSRTAVWKRILKLKKEGYPIEATTKKGYRLLSAEAQYGKSGIQSQLTTAFLGRELKYLPTVASTNTLLKNLAGDGAPEGLVLVADCQEKGRGRLGRSWMSEPGLGVWMSLLLRPKLHPSMVQSLTLAAAVAVCKAIEPYTDQRPGIKWPNDILMGGRKVCGILTEMSAEADRVLWVVIGIGVNVHHSREDFPEELRDMAASLGDYARTDGGLTRSHLAAGILNAFESLYLDYRDNGPAGMIEEWKRYSVTLGRRARLISGEDTQEVRVLDIGQDGRLTVEDDQGRTWEVLSGEISLRPLE